MDKTSKSHLYRFLGKSAGGGVSVDEMQGLLLQVSFAIMMIFMIAYFMFKNKSDAEQAEQIIEIQRQRLIAAVEKTERTYGVRYGLNTLLKMRDDGTEWYDAGAIVERGTLTDNTLLRNAFSSGATAAASDYADKLALRRDWWTHVVAESELADKDISHENRVWLNERVDAAIAKLEGDVRGVQLLSASLLQRHWMAHPADIRDASVAELLRRFHEADEPTRLLLATEISRELRRYSLNVLSEQAAAPMLQ